MADPMSERFGKKLKQKQLDDNAARNAIRLVMSTPEYQLT